MIPIPKDDFFSWQDQCLKYRYGLGYVTPRPGSPWPQGAWGQFFWPCVYFDSSTYHFVFSHKGLYAEIPHLVHEKYALLSRFAAETSGLSQLMSSESEGCSLTTKLRRHFFPGGQICHYLNMVARWLYIAKWIAPPRPPPWRNPRKGRDQMLPSGNPPLLRTIHLFFSHTLSCSKQQRDE